MSGTTVGPYTVLRELGRGGMGRVLLGAGPDGTWAAVKVIRSDLAGDERFRRRFRREIEAARRAPARWTARVLDADPDATTPWVATEFVAGPTLEEHVRERGPLTGRPLRRLAVALFRALVALDRAGLVHRDLKPSNVLLDGGDPGRVRVVDFGIARAADDTRLTSTGAVLGTPAFMAPEQAIGDGDAGPAADVHAVGAMLVFAATGSPPYAGTSAAAVLYRKLHGEADLGGTPEPERGWARRCLARDPHDRPDAARLLAEARRPAFLRRPATSGPRRARSRTAVVVVTAALLLAGGGVAAVLIDRAPATGGTAATGPPSGPSGVATGSAALDVTIPGNGPRATSPPAAPATVDGPVVQLGHRAGRVVAGVGRVYVTDPDTGAVTVLDARGRAVGRVDVGRFPSALALSPDGSRLYATLSTSPTRLVAVDTASLRVAGTVDLPAGDADVVLPADADVTPDGRTVVVADPRGSRVLAVDAATLRTGAARTLAAIPRAAAVTPDGRRLLVSGGTAGEQTGVSVLALPGLAPLATAPGVDATADLVVGPDAAYLANDVASADTGLRVLDPVDGRARSVLPDVPSATRLVAGAGGRWLYALGSPGGGLSALDAPASRVAGTATFGGQDGEDAAGSPDGRALYVAVGRTLRILTVPG